MITLNKINPQTVEVYKPDGELLGVVNEYEFWDIRVQIKQASAEGYYVLFNSEKIIIDKKGKLKTPKGLFQTITDCAAKLF